mmetsp:Transcript_8503/g.28286  ORF Transcript_8503/g.28286 Transcript_8503/m.28286 type:complete len:238 (-) Transcript_8503:33-746(-)
MGRARRRRRLADVCDVLGARRGAHRQLHGLVRLGAHLPQLDRAVAAGRQDRAAVGGPRGGGARRLDALGVAQHVDRPLAALHVERGGVVATRGGDLHVPQPHSAVLRRRRQRLVLRGVPRRSRARRDVSARVPHVADVHVAFHHRGELAPVAVEDDRLVGRARHRDAVAVWGVGDRANLVRAQRLGDVPERPQLSRHAGVVPKVEVRVRPARDEPVARAVEREACHRLRVRRQHELV